MTIRIDLLINILKFITVWEEINGNHITEIVN